jgi:uncharacterized protein (DUF2062 family)
MTSSAMRALLDFTRKVARIDDTPRRTALAFALGVLIAFSPFLGAHLALALVLSFACRLSRAAMVLGTLVNNPWTLVIIYPPSLALGSLILGAGSEPFPNVGWDQAASLEFWRASARHLSGWFPRLLLGTTITGALAAVVSYPLTLRLVRRFRHRGESAANEPKPSRG